MTFVFAIAALAAAGVAGDSVNTNAADIKAVTRTSTDWVDAWNRHDAAGMAGVFAERGDLINPMGHVAKGRAQVLKLFETEQAGRLKQSKMTLTCEPARFFSADIASVDCEYALEGISEPQAPAVLRGHKTDVVMRDGGRWSVISSRAMVPRQLSAAPGATTPAAPKN